MLGVRVPNYDLRTSNFDPRTDAPSSERPSFPQNTQNDADGAGLNHGFHGSSRMVISPMHRRTKAARSETAIFDLLASISQFGVGR